MRSKYDNKLLEEAYGSVLKESDTTSNLFAESFRPGHDMVPAPIGSNTYTADGLRKLWGIQMRAGKWADTFVGIFDDGSFALITPEGVRKYPSVDAFEQAFEQYRTTNTLEDAVSDQAVMPDEAEESVDRIPVSDVEDLAFEGIADRYAGRWVIWNVSFEYQGKQYTGYLSAAPEHPDIYHDDYIEDVQLVADEAEEGMNNIPVKDVEDLAFVSIEDRLSHKWVTWLVSFFYQGQEYTGYLGAVPDHPSEMHDDYIEDAEPVQAPALDEAEEGSTSTPIERFYSKLEDFVDMLSDEELQGGLQLVKTNPRELVEYLRDEFSYRNAMYNDFN